MGKAIAIVLGIIAVVGFLITAVWFFSGKSWPELFSSGDKTLPPGRVPSASPSIEERIADAKMFFTSYRENDDSYEITIRLSFVPEFVTVLYETLPDKLGSNLGELHLERLGEKTWRGSLTKSAVVKSNLTVYAHIDDLNIYYYQFSVGEKSAELPAEIDIQEFVPKITDTVGITADFAQLVFSSNIRMLSADGYYKTLDETVIFLDFIKDDGYKWVATQTIDPKNVFQNEINITFFDNKGTQYTKRYKL